MAKPRFYRGQKYGDRIIKEIWKDSSNYVLLFTDGSYTVVSIR